MATIFEESSSADTAEINRNIAQMIIFNQQSFLDPLLFRRGSEQDVEALNGICLKYGIAGTIKNNLKLNEIKDEVEGLSNTDFTGSKLFMCVLMTHGTKNGLVAAYDRWFGYRKEIIDPILKNRTLNGVPKIFVVVACRGTNHYYEEDGCLLSTKDDIAFSDLLICYSTYDGHVSKRCEYGTYYIQTLCRLLEEDASTDIHMILALVNQTLSKELKRQVPIFESTMGLFSFAELLPYNNQCGMTSQSKPDDICPDSDSGESELKLRLLKDGIEQPHVVVVTGFGGIGKTRLVRNFVQKNESAYEIVFWIDAETPESICESFKSLAKNIFNRTIREDENIVELVFSELFLKKTLIIMDNVQDIEYIAFVLNYTSIGPGLGCRHHAIITSRIRQWDDLPEYIDWLKFNVIDLME